PIEYAGICGHVLDYGSALHRGSAAHVPDEADTRCRAGYRGCPYVGSPNVAGFPATRCKTMQRKELGSEPGFGSSPAPAKPMPNQVEEELPKTEGRMQSPARPR